VSAVEEPPVGYIADEYRSKAAELVAALRGAVRPVPTAG